MTSPSIVRPAQRHRQPKPVPAPRRAAAPKRLRTGLLIGTVITGLLGGCTDGAHPVAGEPSLPMASPPSSPSPSPSPASFDERQRARAQYSKFWASLTPISKLRASKRESALEKFADEPQLSSLLSGMQRIDAKGQMFYGSDLPHPMAIRLSADSTTAVVDDCQDSTHTGLTTKSGLRPITVGVARNHVVVTMKRGTEHVWKVAFVAYTRTPC